MFSSHLFWTSSSLDVPAGVTREGGHTGFLIHLPSAVHDIIFIAKRIQPFLFLVDREVEFFVLTIQSFSTCWAFFFFFFLVRKIPVTGYSNSRPNVSEGYEVTQLRLPTELPGRPAVRWHYYYYYYYRIPVLYYHVLLLSYLIIMYNIGFGWFWLWHILQCFCLLMFFWCPCMMAINCKCTI